MIGTTISHYQIIEKLGEGGMGVVYKARDLRLDRFVCIKVLHPDKLEDPLRKQRFIQEAKAASSLNHPNIVTIHEIDHDGGTDFMVMEFVAGKTILQMIPPNGMPVADVLKYGIPIARALAAANSAGIIHRDVKPGNIMVGANGIVKVLDFGLAKLTAQEAPASVSETDETLTRNADTGTQNIVGTAAYMSPEQAQGEPVDERSDIFSFGAVLYEMVCGRRAFQGANQISTLAAILEREPPSFAERDVRIPREVERVILRCLRKDPERRFQHMADLRVALEEIKEEADSGKLFAAQPTPAKQSRRGLITGLCAALILLAGAGVWLWQRSQPVKPLLPAVTRLTFNGVSHSPTISPDGKLLAYQANMGESNSQIWVQQIGGGTAIQVTHEKDGASDPVFSPEGTEIAYQSHGGVYEVAALGGEGRMITGDGLFPKYAAQGATILFRRNVAGIERLFGVPRAGGEAVAIQPSLAVSFGAISPDGNKLLALAQRGSQTDQDLKRWWLIPVSGGKPEDVTPPAPLASESSAPGPLAWMSDGGSSGQQWVIFSRKTGESQNLFRVAVDSGAKVKSDPEQLTFTSHSNGPSVSENGRMVFFTASISTNLWMIPMEPNRAQVTGDRQSLTQVEGLRDGSPSISRDGRKVAFFSGNRLMVKDLTSGHESQLAQNLPIDATTPAVISPDGSFVVYYLANETEHEYDLYSVSTASGSPRLVCRACGTPKGLSSDGTHLLTQIGYYAGGVDKIGLADLTTGRVTPVLSDPQHHLWNASYSWDDKWAVFLMQSQKVGQAGASFRLYITPVENFVPAGAGRWIQLTSGDYNDDKPQFSPDGNTLYFTSNRDGFTCLWGLRLEPRTKRPVGSPFPVQHFHGSQRAFSGLSDPATIEVSVARDKIVTSLDEYHSDIWMMELEPKR